VPATVGHCAEIPQIRHLCVSAIEVQCAAMSVGQLCLCSVLRKL